LFPPIRWRLLLPLLLLAAAGVQARTLSGTLIVNTVTAGWSNAAGIPYSRTAAVTNTVSDFIDFSVTSVTGRALIGTVTAVPFALTNANNFSDKFRFRVVSNGWTNLGIGIHYDADGNGVIGPGENALTNSPPLGEGAVGRFLFSCSVPSTFPIGRTNFTVLEISSFRTDTMINSRWFVTNRFVTAAWTNRVTPLSASDGVRSVSDFGGSALLDDADIRITVRLDNIPNDASTVTLWYDASGDPDGPGGTNTSDRSVPFIFDGSDWTAVLPADDPFVAEGRQIRFIVASDYVLYRPPTSPSWKFRIKTRPDQGRGFGVFPTVLDLSEGSDAEFTIVYSLSRRSAVLIEIFDLKGELVRSFDQGTRDPDEAAPVHWDGRNHDSRDCAAGLYFVHIRADGLDETRKVIIIK
jgi:hypothetical protein